MKTKNKKEIKKDEFRRNKKTQHPAYIFARVGNEYKYLGITHSKVTKGVQNIKLDKNPNAKDNKESFVLPFAELENVNKFKKKMPDWKMSKSDKQKLKDLMK